MLKVIKEDSREHVYGPGIREHISTKTQSLNGKKMVKYIPLKLKLFVKNKTLHKLEGQQMAYEEGLSRTIYKSLAFQIEESDGKSNLNIIIQEKINTKDSPILRHEDIQVSSKASPVLYGVTRVTRVTRTQGKAKRLEIWF